jgi:hypothetical protein
MNTKYSLTTLLSNLLKLQNNGYQIITSLSDVVSSSSDTVGVDVMDSTGVIQKVYIPSYGSLKNQLVKLESDIKNISGIGDTTSSVQLSDGTFRKILVSSLQKEAEDIKSMSVPTNFNKRENWFFESFMNPLLYVSFDLTGQVKYETENIEVARYILNLDSDQKVRVFNQNFNGKSDIAFEKFVKTILDNNITFFLDKEVIDMPPRKLRFSGNFTVTNMTDVTVDETIDSATFQKRILRLQLDTLFYNDSQSRFQKTQQLKIGDSLVVNKGLKNTRYKITSIDSSTRSIDIRLVEGFDVVTIGTDVLSFYGEEKSTVTADINIGFNEYCVIFVKPIDPDSRIQSVNWSPGVGIYTNNLSIVDPKTGNSTTLSTFYQNEVVDFGAYLYSTVKDKTPPSIFGIYPDPPTIQSSDFKVFQINQHLTESGSLTKLQKLQSEKLRIQSQIQSNDKSILDLRTKIQTTKYTSEKLKDVDENQLTKLINERDSLSSLFASSIDEINKISVSEGAENLTPKYRLRGFFSYPKPKTSDRTSPQEVVQFIIQYRYVKKDGSANQPQQITFTDTDGQTRRGTFSNWVQYVTDVRERKVDPNTGKAYWVTEDLENADSVNINQVDIPIQQGEGIELRIKSISEAGWPVTPLKSDWSTIVKIDFPAEFESLADANSIIEQAKKDSVKVDLQAEITSMNLDKISDQSFTQGNKFFVSDSMHIASGFLTSENNIISLYDKLVSLETELSKIRALVTVAKGTLSVRIVDESGQEYKVENNSTVKIFAGNYRDEVQSLQVQKGVILSKNYFVKISNSSASTLEMYSRIYGSRFDRVNYSFNNNDEDANFNQNDTDYNNIRRYDYVPVGLSNPDPDHVEQYGFIRNSPDQSSQVRGQFINSRYRSVDGKRYLYNKPFNPTVAPGSGVAPLIFSSDGYVSGFNGTWGQATTVDQMEYTIHQPFASGSSAFSGSSYFIWSGLNNISFLIGASSATQSPDYLSNIFVHQNHPDIQSWIDEASGLSVSAYTIAKKYIRNSRLGNIPKGYINSDIQNAFFYEGIGTTANNYCRVSFDDNDQYLLGPRSVGAYLFLNPKSHKEMIVNGSDSISMKTLEFGNENAITIPITFQYRMTDYYGAGDVGTGNVAGLLTSTSSTNLEYTKTIGIDIYSNPKDKDRFSFDLEVTARYYSTSSVTKDIPTRTFETAIDDLAKVVKSITPTTSRDV